MNPKLKDRLLKLLALTKSSNTHESASAQSRIEKLCALHGVNLRDLDSESEEVALHWVSYGSKYEKTVLINVLWKVVNYDTLYRNASKSNQLGYYATTSKAAELDLWWAVMRKAFLLQMDKTLSDLATGFIIANQIYGNVEQTEGSDNEYDVDYDALARAERLAEGITPTQVLQALEEL